MGSNEGELLLLVVTVAAVDEAAGFERMSAGRFGETGVGSVVSGACRSFSRSRESASNVDVSTSQIQQRERGTKGTRVNPFGLVWFGSSDAHKTDQVF